MTSCSGAQSKRKVITGKARWKVRVNGDSQDSCPCVSARLPSPLGEKRIPIGGSIPSTLHHKRVRDSNQKQHSGTADVLVQIFILKFSLSIVSLTELDEMAHLVVNSLEFCGRDRK